MFVSVNFLDVILLTWFHADFSKGSGQCALNILNSEVQWETAFEPKTLFKCGTREKGQETCRWTGRKWHSPRCSRIGFSVYRSRLGTGHECIRREGPLVSTTSFNGDRNKCDLNLHHFHPLRSQGSQQTGILYKASEISKIYDRHDADFLWRGASPPGC